MSYTYVHYSTPSSLPSDYALLSRYAATGPVNHPTQDTDSADVPPSPGLAADELAVHEDLEADALPTEESNLVASRKRPRRSSFPTSYVTPFNPTSMGPLPDKTGHRSGPSAAPTEHTPLLAPLVPRIPEEVDDEDIHSELGSRPNVLWEEMRILTKYTLPVCG
jgi:multidrug resistance protein, MATE family